MENQKWARPKRTTRIGLDLIFMLCLAIGLFAAPLALKLQKESQETGQDYKFVQELKEARAKLQMGVNTWSPELLKTARDLFLNLLLREKKENVYLLYEIALTDYRLVTFYFSSSNREEAERYNGEAQKYLEKAMEVDLSFGESFALYAFLLGFEIALNPEKGMTLGLKSMEYFNKALEIAPDNPRINLLQGMSLLYTPEAYGGGADKALEFLDKSANLFDKEKIQNPLKPSWGKEETYTFIGLAYKQKKDMEKAKECLKKALELNPDFGLAKEELAKLEKEKKES